MKQEREAKRKREKFFPFSIFFTKGTKEREAKIRRGKESKEREAKRKRLLEFLLFQCYMPLVPLSTHKKRF